MMSILAVRSPLEVNGAAMRFAIAINPFLLPRHSAGGDLSQVCVEELADPSTDEEPRGIYSARERLPKSGFRSINSTVIPHIDFDVYLEPYQKGNVDA